MDPSELPQLLDRVVQLCCNCLETSSVTGRPGWCGFYHGLAPADCCDSLVLSIERITTIKTFPQESMLPLRCDVLPMVSFAVQLFRPCWPTVVQNAQNPFPGNEATEIASINSMIDAAALYCCLQADLANHNGFVLQGNPLNTRVGQMTPGKPMGGCFSWTVHCQLELDPCCNVQDARLM